MIKQLKYEESDLKKLHEIQIEILKEIIRICDKYDLKWFVTYGTLLGTVRHHGFIPWDDDIDIGLLREDYDKFFHIAQKELKEGFYLSHYLIDDKVPHYFMKIRKDNTLFVEGSVSHINMHHGIFIDIFPYDSVPKDKIKRKKFAKKVIALNKLFITKSTTKGCDNSSKIKYFINSFAKKILRCLIFGISKKQLYDKLDKLAHRYSLLDTNLLVHTDSIDTPLIYIDDIFPTVKMRFEDIEVEVPNAYDKILASCYGDYMKLPAEEKRINHAPKELCFDVSSCKDKIKYEQGKNENNNK